MKAFEEKRFYDDPKVIKVKTAIAKGQKELKEFQSELDNLDKLVNETSTQYNQALADFKMDNIDKDKFAKIEAAYKEIQSKKHKSSSSSAQMLENKKAVLMNLESGLKKAEEEAKGSIVQECKEFIDTAITEIKDPIKQIKNVIKEISKALTVMRWNSYASSLPFRYDFTLKTINQIYNYLTILESTGTEDIHKEFIEIFDNSIRFLEADGKEH